MLLHGSSSGPPNLRPCFADRRVRAALAAMASTKDGAVALTQEDEEELMKVDEENAEPEGLEDEQMSDAETEEQELPEMDGKVREARNVRCDGHRLPSSFLASDGYHGRMCVNCFSNRCVLVERTWCRRTPTRDSHPEKTLPKTRTNASEWSSTSSVMMRVLL